ncbi:MAG TPA: aminodeoxychorismate synthase component I, partial [Sphingomicrobium sp.]|nr:aminodeoxychorismate synthase component I [Sphingomicrobium sp.]
LYEQPADQVAAMATAEVRPALAHLRAALADGRHAAGFIAYEAAYALEPKLAALARQSPGPLLWFGLFDRFRRLPSPDLEAMLGDPSGAWTGRPQPRIGREDYLAAGARVREHLFAGDFYQANLTFGCDVTLLGSPMAAYARLRRRSRAGWGGILRHPQGWLLSLSPEQFFTIRGQAIEARPMKGTARRHANPGADAAAAAQLAADPKQRSENMMIVDLLRNDLARVAETGSVAVPELFAVETYPTVHQMVSRITASLRGDVDAVAVLETLFPCGSITGAPKLAAMAALRALEPEPRGAYTGTMGWIEPGGGAAFNVLIRTLELAGGADTARLGLGSGLVVDSRLDDEWAECLLKGEFVAPDETDFDLIETMRFDPQAGVADLDRHLDRLARSAHDLQFQFDRHAARNELQAATFRRKEPAMIRLLLSPKGSMAIEVKALPRNPAGPVDVAVRPLPLDPADFRLRYKTTDKDMLRQARREAGTFETVFTDPEGRLTEGSYTSLFVERDGRLLTPPLERGLLPGLLRARLLQEGKAEEADLTVDDLKPGFLIGNMVRGLMKARLA